MKKLFKYTFRILLLYITICSLLYFFQENLIFFPQKLDKTHQFNFENSFEEKYIETNDGISLNGLLFKADNSKGLIFYLHGNAGSLKLKELFKKQDTLITLIGQGHNGMTYNEDYKKEINRILKK